GRRGTSFSCSAGPTSPNGLLLLVATERIAIGTVGEAGASAGTVAPLSHVLGEAPRRDLGYAFAKRFIDIVAAAMVLLVMLPVFVAIAIAIRLETAGPVFYRAERVGRFGKPFTVLKFRSMRAGCSTTPHVDF